MGVEQLPLVVSGVPGRLGARDVTPLSVLQTARGDWQSRRRAWRDAGLTDDVGREHLAIWPTITDGSISWQRAASSFDPVLADVHYGWYCRPCGRVLDPFGGGPTRGVVAAVRGFRYTGVDLSAGQVEANRVAYQGWVGRGVVGGSAEWVHGAAQRVLPGLCGGFDYAFTCPPYFDLERYSAHPDDLSAMTWEGFTVALAEVVAAQAALLVEDAFATWVIGDVRDKAGHLRRLPSLVADVHEAAGMPLVNDAVVAAPLGGKFGVIWRSWNPTRSATRIHSYALTFVKGDRRRAACRVGLPG